MSSLVELKDACLNKALQVVDSIQPDEEEAEQRSRVALNLLHAACAADTQANQDAWAKSQSQSNLQEVQQ